MSLGQKGCVIKMQYYLIIFENTIQVLIAEEEIKKVGIAYKIVPTPTEVIKSCGLSIVLEDIEPFNTLNREKKLKLKGIYSVENRKYTQVRE